MKRVLSLVSLALAAQFAQAEVTKMIPYLDMGKRTQQSITVCNNYDYPTRIDVVPMQYPDGDRSLAMVPIDTLTIRPNSRGTLDNPVPPAAIDPAKGCPTFSVSIPEGKRPDKAQIFYLRITQNPVRAAQQEAGTLTFNFQTNTMLMVGADINDQVVLKGALTGDGLLLKNVGRRPLSTNNLKIDGRLYPITNRQIFAESEAVIKLPSETLEAIQHAIAKGDPVAVQNHLSMPIQVAL
jgi:hypothetical protein